MSEKPIVLFLCTANACRSQMGEALCRALWGEHVVSISAGASGMPCLAFVTASKHTLLI